MRNVNQIDMNIDKLINDMNNSGELVEIFTSAWELTISPQISHVNVTKYDSKERREDAVIVKHMSENIHIENKLEKVISVSSQLDHVELPPIIPDVAQTTANIDKGEEFEGEQVTKDHVGFDDEIVNNIIETFGAMENKM